MNETIENQLSSLMKQKTDIFESRKILKSYEMERIKWNLENDLKNLINQTAKLMNITAKSQERIIEGLILDFQSITEQEHIILISINVF